MLKNGLRFVLLDGLRHHVQNVVHNGSTQLKIIVGFDTLLGDCLGHTLAIPTFELASKQVTQPTWL